MNRACKPIRDRTMSYILDALKRADAERERGAVPGLHARQVTTSDNQPAAGKRSHLGLAIAAPLTLGFLAVGLWLWQKPEGATRLASVQPNATITAASAPLVAPVSAAAPAGPAASAPELAPAVAVLPTVAASSPAVSAIVTSAAISTPAQKPLPSAKVAAGRTTPTATATAPPAAPPLLSELSENFRRALPPLTVSGAVYSDNPGQRLLLVNGQVVTQGGPAAAEVTLEEIGARSSVFSYRGTRFRLAH